MSREAKILTGILIVVVGGMIGLFALANSGSATPTPTGAKDITRPTSHKEGNGPIQMVEFGDYQCPACGAAYPNVQEVLKNYGSDITFYFRNFPLTQLHPNAMAGAQAAEAAALQGKFWQMHNMLYQNQTTWADLADPTQTFASYANALGLDTNKFQSDMTSTAVKTTIAQDQADGNALKIDATPTFYFNGQQYTGGYDYASLAKQVQSLLNQKK